MMKEYSLFNTILINIFIIAMWETLIFLACNCSDDSMFDASRTLYRQYKWEKDGKWYSKNLHINKWKDYLPQLSGKRIFSKRHLESVSLEYVDRFIMETCRGEWDHVLNMFVAIPLLLLERAPISLVFASLLVITNVPYIFIQRYNRFRLQKLKSRIMRGQRVGDNFLCNKFIEEDTFSNVI